jgi:ketosteroid isomerase-like protein
MADVNISLTVRWVSAAVLALALAVSAGARPQSHGMPRAERHESRHEIDQLEQTWKDALMRRSASAMEGLLADDYIAITPNGTLQSKDQTLANLRAGATQIKSIDFSDRKVRFYGQTALVTSRAEVSGTNAEGDFSGSYRYTRVYVRDEQGKWKIVSFEASRIRNTDDHK